MIEDSTPFLNIRPLLYGDDMIELVQKFAVAIKDARSELQIFEAFRSVICPLYDVGIDRDIVDIIQLGEIFLLQLG